MQGLQHRAHWARWLAVIGLLALSFLITGPASASQSSAAQADSDRRIAHRISTDIELFGPSTGLSSEVRTVQQPGARFIKLHFSSFVIPDGVAVMVMSPDGSERYTYWRNRLDAHTWDASQGDDGVTRFSAMSISGDTAVVRIIGRLDRMRAGVHRVHLDHYLSGYAQDESPFPPAGVLASPAPQGSVLMSDGPGISKPQTTCGINERYDAVCFKDSHRAEYETAHAVAVLVTSSGEECTAWRVGPDNRLFTAQHCVGSQADVTGAEIWFNYKARSCGSSSTENVVKVTGATFLAADAELDYGLFTVNNFQDISGFGYLGLDVREGSLGEGVFIPQHGLGRPAQLALESDMNDSGYCAIDDVSRNGYGTDTDIGYYCDTTTSSSGSPVITAFSGKVIALHHLGGCMNSGSKMKLIWPQVAEHFGGEIPDGDVAWSGGGWDSGPPANESPVADFEFACEGLACSFDGAASYDPDGSVVDWSWSFGDGDSASGSSPVHDFSAGGSYSVSLTVTDDAGGEDVYTRRVDVTAPAQPPSASFSISCVNNDCSFDAGGSSDADGVIVDYQWSLGDGTVGEGQAIEHTYADEGTYSVSLTVSDDDGLSADRTHTVTVSLPNQPPEADFAISCEGLNCEFDASASQDADGEVSAWVWSTGDGAGADGMVVNHTFETGGSYEVVLTVTDDDGVSSSTARTAVVSADPGNRSPQARFSVECSEGSCRFDAADSFDPDGEVVAYTWSLGTGAEASGAVVEYTYAESGSYNVRLTVRDEAGAENETQQKVDIELPQTSPNERPQASFEFLCEDTICAFDAGASHDPDGHIEKYEWEFGDGEGGTSMLADYVYPQEGTYTVTLTVTDDAGYVGTARRTVVAQADRPITLKVGGGGIQGKTLAVLKWSGAESSQVDIYRDGKLLARTANKGLHVDKMLLKRAKSLRYQLCEPGSGHCSGEVMLK
ncbi:PKD domain-containing protein [Elongatibacter sediminis]|uniref:PKD domain-containing protein n=1 Tax=Elongatibacter sediminis TaxID=3119006 RepID=A0AAW9RKC4_9GAMM